MQMKNIFLLPSPLYLFGPIHSVTMEETTEQQVRGKSVQAQKWKKFRKPLKWISLLRLVFPLVHAPTRLYPSICVKNSKQSLRAGVKISLLTLYDCLARPQPLWSSVNCVICISPLC